MTTTTHSHKAWTDKGGHVRASNAFKSLSRTGFSGNGGGGIRTHGAFRHAGFQDRSKPFAQKGFEQCLPTHLPGLCRFV